MSNCIVLTNHYEGLHAFWYDCKDKTRQEFYLYHTEKKTLKKQNKKKFNATYVLKVQAT